MYNDPVGSMFPNDMPQGEGSNMNATSSIPMAHGGKAEKGEYIFAHFNKNELPALDVLQGKATYIPGTKIRHYKNLEKRFMGDHEFKHQTDGYLKEMAKGGHIVHLRDVAAYMKKMGRYGDHQMALIGPHTRAYLDHYAGGGNINPHTRMPEYFNLGDVLGGIGSRVSPYIEKAGNFIGNKLGGGSDLGTRFTQGASDVFGKYIKPAANFVGKFAEPVGNAIGAEFGDPTLGSQIENYGSQADQYLNPHGAPPNPEGEQSNVGRMTHMANQYLESPYGQATQRGIREGYDAYRRGATLPEMSASYVRGATSDFNNPAARFAHGAASSYLSPSQRDMGMRGHMAAGLEHAIGNESVGARAAGAAVNHYGRTGNPIQSMRAGMNNLRQSPNSSTARNYASPPQLAPNGYPYPAGYNPNQHNMRPEGGAYMPSSSSRGSNTSHHSVGHPFLPPREPSSYAPSSRSSRGYPLPSEGSGQGYSYAPPGFNEEYPNMYANINPL